MMSPVIEIRNLTKLYNGVAAVDKLDITVKSGEVFGLLGPNGAGKTTTILSILGLTDISSGSVRVLGMDPARHPLSVKSRIGYMPDTVGFYEYLTARENLSYTGRLAGLGRKTINERIEETLAEVGLEQKADSRVSTFSRGMRQRLGLADVLLKKPEIVILDEPTSGLDPQGAFELLTLIRQLKGKGVTVILSSHLLDRVQVICDRVALFSKGRARLVGSVNELSEKVLGGGHRIMLEAKGANLEKALRELPGIVQVRNDGDNKFTLEADRDVRSEVARQVINAGGDIYGLSIRQANLDTVYRKFFEEVDHAA